MKTIFQSKVEKAEHWEEKTTNSVHFCLTLNHSLVLSMRPAADTVLMQNIYSVLGTNVGCPRHKCTNVRHAISQGGINTPFSGRHIVTLWSTGALKNTKIAENKASKRNGQNQSRFTINNWEFSWLYAIYIISINHPIRMVQL